MHIKTTIIHRDLKPANIPVVDVDGKPLPRIIDFGLAKKMVPEFIGAAQVTVIGSFWGRLDASVRSRRIRQS